MTKTWNLGIIGAGLIWDKAHKGAIRRLGERVRIAAFAARSAETRAKVTAEFPEAAVYADYRELLKSGGIDAVAVLTPIPLNAPVTIEALEAGKHVFVEKPLARSADEARRVAEAERRTGRQVCVLEQVRYAEDLLEAKKLLDEGRIGRVAAYDRVAHYRLDGETAGYGKTVWRAEPNFPLGTLFDGGIHQISELSYLFGAPETVYARGAKLREGFGDYDNIVMTLTHPGGVVGTFGHAGCLSPARNYFYIRGDAGILHYTMQAITIDVYGEPDPDIINLHAGIGDATFRTWERGFDVLDGRAAALRYGTAESVADIALLEAVDRSLRTGEPVRM